MTFCDMSYRLLIIFSASLAEIGENRLKVFPSLSSSTFIPKDYGETACIVERLERHEDAQLGSDQCTQPYESEDNPRSHGFSCRAHGDECKRGVAAGNMPVYGRVVELSCYFLCLLS